VASNVDDCVKTVADHLCSQLYSRKEVEAVVRLEVRDLLPVQIAQPPIFGRQSENQLYAKEIDVLVGELLRKLEGAPPRTRDVLFILASRTQPLSWSLDVNSPAAKHFKTTLLTGLTDLRRGCEEVRRNKNGIGDHHNRNQAKQLCAGCALDLIVGLDAGRPTNSSPQSPIRVIAGLLFEAVAPDQLQKKKRQPDLLEQCRETVAHWRSMSDVGRGTHIDAIWATWEFKGMIARKSASSM